MGSRSGRGKPEACLHEHTFGGQAVIEGVMMRGRHSWGVAVRRPSGGIARVAFPLATPGSNHRLLKLPVVRGVIALYESMSLGIKALSISANVGLEGSVAVEPSVESGSTAPAADADSPGATEPPSFGWKELAVTVVVAVAMAVVLFVVVPLVVVKHFESTFSNRFVFNLVEGLIRICIFLLYIVGISLIPDLRRVFEYHGAEHKVIHAYEACGEPDAEHAQAYSTLHPRCGTGFLLLVMVIAVLVFAVVGKPSLPWLVLSRIIGIPVIVGISYEIGIKWAGKHPSGLLARILLWPGLQLQRLTTREPTAEQLEVAAAALDDVIRMDAAEQGLAEEAFTQ
jgi:uncharacterized protein YqhQ